MVLSPEGLKKVWAIKEVQEALAYQDEVRLHSFPTAYKMYSMSLLHGYSLKDVKDTDEGKAYRKAYNATRTVIQCHSAYAFGLEQQAWFKSQLAR